MTMKQFKLPGLEEMEHDKEIDYHTGRPTNNFSQYFDAATLPDAPGYQINADNAQTYVMFIIFPSLPALEEGLGLLTGGYRTSLPAGTRFASISAIKLLKNMGMPLIDYWRKKLKLEG